MYRLQVNEVDKVSTHKVKILLREVGHLTHQPSDIPYCSHGKFPPKLNHFNLFYRVEVERCRIQAIVPPHSVGDSPQLYCCGPFEQVWPGEHQSPVELVHPVP